jgi:hypothetical protein
MPRVLSRNELFFGLLVFDPIAFKRAIQNRIGVGGERAGEAGEVF